MAVELGLGNFGLPTTSQQDLLTRRVKDNAQRSREYAVSAYGSEKDRAMYTLGNVAGDALMKQFGGGISDEEKRRLAAADAAEAKIQTMRQTSEWEAMDSAERAMSVQDITTAALYDQGFVQDAAAMGTATDAQRVAKQKSNSELRKLDMSDKEAEIQHGIFKQYAQREADAAITAKEQGVQKSYFIQNPDGTWGETEVYGTLTKDNTLMVDNKEIPAGKFTPDVKSHGTSTLEQRKLLGTMFNPTQQGKIRETAKGLAQTTRINNNILRMLGESAQETGEINFLGGAGKGVGWINTMVNNVKSAFRTADGVSYQAPVNIGGVRQGDGSYKGGKNITIGGLAKDRDSETAQALGEAMGKLGYTGDMANKYQSQVMELAYATARANEPGARQLSDADIANALRIIGTNATNPEAMRQIFRDNVSRAVKKHEDNISSVPRGLRHLIVTPDLEDRMQSELDTFASLSSEEYGTAEKPGEALMNMDTAPEDDLSIRRPGMNAAIENARTVTLPGAKTAAPPAQDNDPSGQVAESAVVEAVEEAASFQDRMSLLR